MKLLRYGEPGKERPALLDADGIIRDLSHVLPDLGPDTLGRSTMDHLRSLDTATLPPVSASERIGPCVAGTRNIICVGLNYADHAEEADTPLPKEPYLFLKSVHSIIGPNDVVELPRGALKGDWEVELAIIIGTKAKSVPLESAIDHIAGYCIINDLSERTYQFEQGGDIAKGKSCDTFAPIGPWLVTPDEIPDVQDLAMTCVVSGETMQSSSTKAMVHGALKLVSYISHYMTLMPGDIIASGTPSGVGMIRGRFLRDGDEMILRVDRLGEQRQRVVAL